MLLAQEWLRQCFEGRHWCTFNLREIPQLPTRVINVGPPDGSKQPVLCLTNGEKGHYLALSHCWGSTKIITTTSTTLLERTNGIPFDSLSKTFQDAILVTRGLGLNFLWIDSLCILQDSSDDWETESAKMGQYYKNSLVTIAAVSAKGGEEGCFRKRNMLQVTPCPVPMQADIPGVPNIGGWFIRPTWQPDQGGKSNEQARGAPLDLRAWAFQERLMSPRVLQFEEYQMSFICYDGGASEQYPEGFPEQRSYLTSPFETVRDKFGDLQAMIAIDGGLLSPEKTKAENDEKKRDIWQYWRNLICSYSGRDITYRTDVLPALSGLASQIASITGGTYLAGLWKEDIHRELLWTKEGSPAAPYLDRVPPTWSWTSTQREGTDRQSYMRFPLEDGAILDEGFIWDETCFLLLEALITVPGKNPYGQPSEGVLRVSGFLKQATHYIAPQRPEWAGAQKFNLIDKDEYIGRFRPDNLPNGEAKAGGGTMIWCCPVMTKNGPIPSDSSNEIGSHIKAKHALPKVGATDEWLEIINYFQGEGDYSKATIKPTVDDYLEAESNFREYNSTSDNALEGMIKVACLALAPTGVRPGEMVLIGSVDVIGGWFDDCERVEFTII